MLIRQLCKSDAPRMLEWMHNKNVTEFFRFDGSAATIDSVTKFIQKSTINTTDKNYAVCDSTNRYMGTVSLKNIDIINGNAEYAIALHQDAIGKGYATFATDAILNVAFAELNLHRVYLNVLSINVRAIKFYEKYGFVYEGEFINHVMHNNKLENLKWYRILKEEYNNKNQ